MNVKSTEIYKLLLGHGSLELALNTINLIEENGLGVDKIRNHLWVRENNIGIFHQQNWIDSGLIFKHSNGNKFTCSIMNCMTLT